MRNVGGQRESGNGFPMQPLLIQAAQLEYTADFEVYVEKNFKITFARNLLALMYF